MFELTIITSFSSAHNLRDYKGACENLHGHNFRVEVAIEASDAGADGMVLDFKRLKAFVRRVTDPLDHKYLNGIAPFDKENATAENIARHIFKGLKRRLNKGNVRVSRVRVWESETAGAAYYE
ncbi:MAG: 6-carboxytetrahydropterin synthase QueD [Deltaproteobacteria bacterium]